MRRRLLTILLTLVMLAPGVLGVTTAPVAAAPVAPPSHACQSDWVDMRTIEVYNKNHACSADLPDEKEVQFTADNTDAEADQSFYVGQFFESSTTQLHLHSLKQAPTTNGFAHAIIDAENNTSNQDVAAGYADDASYCADMISDEANGNYLTTGATVTLNQVAPGPATDPNACVNKGAITLHPDSSSIPNRFGVFTWSDSGEIDTTEQKFVNVLSGTSFGGITGVHGQPDATYDVSAPFLLDKASGDYISKSSGANGCYSYLKDIGAGNATATLVIQRQDGNEGCLKDSQNGPFILTGVALLGTKNADKKAGTGLGSQSTSDSTDTSPQLSCHAGYNPLNWLVCGVIDGLTKIIGQVDAFISSQLNINTNTIFTINHGCSSSSTSSDCSGYAYYKAWSAFRDISLGLMVVAGLVVIITQALGFEILDAYTIRKVLPRLVVAAIAITISWSLMQFFVTLTNDLGYGIRSLIYSPFNKIASDSVSLGGQLTAKGVVTSAGVTLATGAAIVSLGIFGLLSFVGTAALAVFVAFLVLVIRQILITMLIILAPVALVAYILPNTNKVFKIWWDSFSKALMMFPIISGFIAAGRVMSVVASTNTSNPFSQFIAFAAYFAPYMLLPLTFRFAGGALSNIGGFVNDKHKGGFDRLRNFRGKKMNENLQKTGNFQRFNDSNILGRGANTALGAVFNPRAAARGRGGLSAARQAGRTTQGAAALKDDKVFQANQNDDNFLLALANRDLAEQKQAAALKKSQDMSLTAEERAGAKSEADIRQNALNAASQVRSRNSSGTRLAALEGLAKSGYQFDYGEPGYEQLQQTVQSIVGNDAGAQNAAMNNAQFHLKNAGRLDLAGINNNAAMDVKGGVRRQGNYGRGQGKVGTYHGASGAWLGASTVDTETGKTLGDQIDPATGAVIATGSQRMADAMAAALNDPTSGVSDDSILEWNNMLAGDYSSATDANKLEIDKQMEAIAELAQRRAAAGGGVLTQTEAAFVDSVRNANNIKNRMSGIDPSLRP